MLKVAQADADRLRAEAAVKLEEDVKRRALMAERKIALAESQAAGEVKAAAADMAALAAEAVLAARVGSISSDPLIDAGLSRLAARFS
jgi:F-type H+-transporting ATPase subunit b